MTLSECSTFQYCPADSTTPTGGCCRLQAGGVCGVYKCVWRCVASVPLILRITHHALLPPRDPSRVFSCGPLLPAPRVVHYCIHAGCIRSHSAVSSDMQYVGGEHDTTPLHKSTHTCLGAFFIRTLHPSVSSGSHLSCRHCVSRWVLLPNTRRVGHRYVRCDAASVADDPRTAAAYYIYRQPIV